MDNPVVSRAEWLAARKDLLAKEAELARTRQELIEARRKLPMTEVTSEYRFEGPDGQVGLADLFEGRRQLIVYHFMFDPQWSEGCKHCSLILDNVGHLSHINALNTTFALASRAPYQKIAAFRERMGWSVPWYSVDGPSFNHDFHVALGDAYNPEEMGDPEDPARFLEGEAGVFVREGDRILHAYSTYDGGIEIDLLHGTFNLLDMTPLGRQDDAPGRPWLFHHDRYPQEALAGR